MTAPEGGGSFLDKQSLKRCPCLRQRCASHGDPLGGGWEWRQPGFQTWRMRRCEQWILSGEGHFTSFLSMKSTSGSLEDINALSKIICLFLYLLLEWDWVKVSGWKCSPVGRLLAQHGESTWFYPGDSQTGTQEDQKFKDIPYTEKTTQDPPDIEERGGSRERGGGGRGGREKEGEREGEGKWGGGRERAKEREFQ